VALQFGLAPVQEDVCPGGGEGGGVNPVGPASEPPPLQPARIKHISISEIIKTCPVFCVIANLREKNIYSVRGSCEGDKNKGLPLSGEKIHQERARRTFFREINLLCGEFITNPVLLSNTNDHPARLYVLRGCRPNQDIGRF
jgi:hypothetical protein